MVSFAKSQKEKELEAAIDGTLVLSEEKERAYFFEKCKSERELKTWIKYFLDLSLPDTTVSRFADCNPQDMIWDIYNKAVLGNNQKKVKDIIYLAARGAGKCNRKGTKILLLNNELKDIENIKIGDIIYTGWSWKKVLNTFDEGVKKGIEIVDKNGNTLCGTPHHRIQAYCKIEKKVKWIELKDIKVGDLVYKSYLLPNKIKNNKYVYLVKDRSASRKEIEDYINKNAPDQKELLFLRSGNLEKIEKINQGDYYFYDLEVEDDHSYWSNGFISHNTLGLAISEFLCIVHAHRDVAHIGVILPQAERCYDYFKSMIRKPRVARHLLPEDKASTPVITKTNMKKTEFIFPNRDECAYEILPCTMQALNGKHSDFVSTDEVDTADKPETLKAFNEIEGIVDSRDGKLGMRIGISTRKSRFGLMNRMIEEAEKAGRTVKRWTALEFTQRCLKDRYGDGKIDIYVNQDDMYVITKKEYDEMLPNKQKVFTHHIATSGCAVCPAFSICYGDLKKQTSKSNMLKPVEDLIQKVRSGGVNFALSQLVNLKPSMEGIVYNEYDPSKHLKTWNELWEKLTGKKYPKGDCTHDIFIQQCKNLNLTCVAGVDFGFSAPSTLVVAYIDKKENVYIVRAIGETGVNDATWVQLIKDKYHRMYNVSLYYPDVADPSAIQIMQQNGLPIAKDIDKSINLGIQTIKRFLRVPGSQDVKLFIAKETAMPLADELTLYHYKMKSDGTISEIPDTDFDHYCFTEGHQILTKSGWKDFKDLGKQDLIANIDKNKNIYFNKPQNIIKYQYNGEVYLFNHKPYFSFEVTPDHNVIYITQADHRKNKTDILRKCKPKDIEYNEIFIPQSARINRASTYKQPFPELDLSDKEWAYLLGAFLSEGCTNINYSHHRVQWVQKKERVLNKYISLFDKIKEKENVQVQIYNGVYSFVLLKKKYFNYFVQFGKSKDRFIPRDILENADRDILLSLYDGLMDGDGSRIKNNNDYSTASMQLAKDFCELSTICGFTAHIKYPYIRKNPKYLPQIKVRISTRSTKMYPVSIIKKKNIIKKQYAGMVYCVTSNTGMIMIRKGDFGANFISGNCDSLKYLMLGMFSNMRPLISTGEIDNLGPMRSADGAYHRAPTAEEYATENNLPFNDNKYTGMEGYGKIGTLNDLNSDENDEEKGGGKAGGGVNFVF